MLQIAIKVLLTSLLVVAAAEASKRNVLVGAVIASLPLTSLLAMGWLWADTGDAEKVASLASGIFWLIPPSLVLLLALPILLRNGVSFWPSVAISIALTAASYWAMLELLRRAGIDV